MNWKFSGATGGFYPADSLDEYPYLPVDLVDVSAERKAELMLTEPGAKMIVADVDGNPVVVDRPGPTDAELASTARAMRDQLLGATDWMQLPDVPAATKEKYVAYGQALRDLSEQAGFPDTVDLPKFPT
ncbi:tail fiber assembly protein [Cupriavidus basilensis]